MVGNAGRPSTRDVNEMIASGMIVFAVTAIALAVAVDRTVLTTTFVLKTNPSESKQKTSNPSIPVISSEHPLNTHTSQYRQ
jgi:hypothetical protein